METLQFSHAIKDNYRALQQSILEGPIQVRGAWRPD